MFERFTDRNRKVLALANQEAHKFNSPSIEPEHMLLGILRHGDGVGAEVLKQRNLSVPKLCRELSEELLKNEEVIQTDKLPRSQNGNKIIEFAIAAAKSLNHHYVGSEHTLIALTELGGTKAHTFLQQKGITTAIAKELVLKILNSEVEPDDSSERLAIPPSDRQMIVEAAQLYYKEALSTPRIMNGAPYPLLAAARDVPLSQLSGTGDGVFFALIEASIRDGKVDLQVLSHLLEKKTPRVISIDESGFALNDKNLEVAAVIFLSSDDYNSNYLNGIVHSLCSVAEKKNLIVDVGTVDISEQNPRQLIVMLTELAAIQGENQRTLTVVCSSENPTFLHKMREANLDQFVDIRPDYLEAVHALRLRSEATGPR